MRVLDLFERVLEFSELLEIDELCEKSDRYLKNCRQIFSSKILELLVNIRITQNYFLDFVKLVFASKCINIRIIRVIRIFTSIFTRKLIFE